MIKKSPLVSVYMVTRNRSDYFMPLAVESILSQTLSDFEFIILDDGSTDATYDVLKKYQEKDDRIVLVKQEHSGLTIGRNKAVSYAKGEYICNMDDDDVSLPDRLKEQVAFLRKHRDLKACVCLTAFLDQKREIYRKQVSAYYDRFSATGAVFKEVPVTYCLNSTVMMTRSAFEHCGGYRSFFYFSQDYDFTLRFQERFQAALVPLYLYNRYKNRDHRAITSQNFFVRTQLHIIAHISAWYRRNKRVDPIEENKSKEEILRLLPDMPVDFRCHLLVFIQRYIEEVKHTVYNKESKEIRDLLGVIQSGLIWRSSTHTIIEMQLILRSRLLHFIYLKMYRVWARIRNLYQIGFRQRNTI